MRIFISTGEVSGDLQGAMLIKSLYQVAIEKNIDLEIAGLGGDRMKATGAKIIANTISPIEQVFGFITSLTISLSGLNKEIFETVLTTPPLIKRHVNHYIGLQRLLTHSPGLATEKANLLWDQFRLGMPWWGMFISFFQIII